MDDIKKSESTSDGEIIRQIINEKLKQIGLFVFQIYQHTQSLEFELEDRSRILYYLESIEDYRERLIERINEMHKKKKKDEYSSA